MFLSITLASLFVPIGEVALLAPFVLVIRGPQAIGRVPPSRCNSLFSWLFYEWNFWGKGCRQEGRRVLGLEVAVQGSLH